MSTEKEKEILAQKERPSIHDMLQERLDDKTTNNRRTREKLEEVLTSKTAEGVIGGMIGLNYLLIWAETDYISMHGAPPVWVHVLSNVFTCIFVVELLVRIFTYQDLFFHSGWNIMDLSIITVDIVSIFFSTVISSSISSLRMLGLLRLLRSVKIMRMLPQLALMVRSLIATLEVLIYGVCILMFSLLTISIFAVQLIHPINQKIAATGAYDGCERCPRAFESVLASALTFTQQTVCGDSWGLVSIPIIEDSPWTAVFFAVQFVAIHLLLMNLILSLICDTAAHVSQDDTRMLLKDKEKEFMKQSKNLKSMCASMDTDGNGSLTLDELIAGFDNHEDFRNTLHLMDVRREDIYTVFEIVDKDDSGTLEHDEFVDELHRMRTEESHTLLVFIKHGLKQVMKTLDNFATTQEGSPQSGDVVALQGAHEHLQQQVQQEMRELSTKINRQHEEVLQYLSDLERGQSSSRWRAGLKEALGHSARVGGEKELPQVHAKDIDDATSKSHRLERATPPRGGSNLMPCCQVQKHADTQCITAASPVPRGAFGSDLEANGAAQKQPMAQSWRVGA